MADNEHIAEIGRLLAQRYNVRAVDGDLGDALAAGDVETLATLIGEREMYRWASPIARALRAARGVQPEETEASEPEPEEAEAISVPVPEPAEETSPSVEAEEPAPDPKPSRSRHK